MANPFAVYRSGQVVSFRVHLILREPVKCKALCVKQFGNSRIYWISRAGDSIRRFSSEEIYIDQKVDVYSPETSGMNGGFHPAGEFYYPGRLQIPNEAPSSYEGYFGRIRYYVQASIVRPPMADSYCEKLFTVIRDLDLNVQPVDLAGPCSIEGDYEIQCCCQASTWCQSLNHCYGLAQGTINLSKRGYVPGEQVRVTGELRNTSRSNIYSVNLQICQKTIFHDSYGHIKTDSRVVSSVEAPGIIKGGTLQLDYLIPVGPVANSHLEGCKNMELSYYLQIQGEGGCCGTLIRECELLIGTTPLWSSFDSSVPSLIHRGAYDGPMMETVSSRPQSQKLSPPQTYTYAECMFGRVAIDKAEGENFNGETQWAPSYPVYIMPPAPAQQPVTEAPHV